MDDPDPAGGVTPALTLLWEFTPLTRDDWDPIPVADLLRLQHVYSCSALFWHFQGPCACWMWFLSVLLPHILLCLLTSLCLTAPIPAWLTAHCPVQLTQTGLDVSSCLIKHLFSTISISQAPVLCPETSGVVSGSASPQQPICTILGMISPCCPHGTRWTQQQLLGCFLPASQAGNMTARTAAFWRVKQKHKEQDSVQQRLRHREGKFVCLYFGALQLRIPTSPSSSLKPFPHPLCSLFMFTCYPINSPFSCAPAVALSSDNCTGAINPLDCIQLWKIPIWAAGAFICE